MFHREEVILLSVRDHKSVVWQIAMWFFRKDHKCPYFANSRTKEHWNPPSFVKVCGAKRPLTVSNLLCQCLDALVGFLFGCLEALTQTFFECPTMLLDTECEDEWLETWVSKRGSPMRWWIVLESLVLN